MIIIKQKTFFLLLLVALTMLSISQLIGLSKANEQAPYMPRHINLSGNIIHFSMPENFSQDFPAEDLVENVNLDDPELLKAGQPLELLRRWWDFKDDSFFSRDKGTMMMTIHLYRINKSSKNISHPVEFISVLLDEMKKRYNEENKGRSNEDKKYYPEFYRSFFEEIYNNQKWIKGGASTADESQIEFHKWKPLTENYYLGVEFHFAPSNNISMRNFIDLYAREMMLKIMSTFEIVYSEKNPIKEKLEANKTLKLENLIEALK